MNFGNGPFQIKILNTDSIVTNMLEFVQIAGNFVQVGTMRGKHRVIVQNNRLHYEFEIKRNITIIRGDSATGKTTLINMLRQAENLGNSSGIEVSCDVPCRILEGSNWKLILEHTENRSPGRIYTDFHIVQKKYMEFIQRESIRIPGKYISRCIRSILSFKIFRCIQIKSLWKIPILDMN